MVRKYGTFGKGIKFNFSVAALMTVRARPRIMRFVRGYVKAEVEMRFEAEPPGDNIRIELHVCIHGIKSGYVELCRNAHVKPQI